MKLMPLIENVNVKELLLHVQQKLLDERDTEATITHDASGIHLTYNFEPGDDGDDASSVDITISIDEHNAVSAFIESLSERLGDFDEQVDLTVEAILAGLEMVESRYIDAAKDIWHLDDDDEEQDE